MKKVRIDGTTRPAARRTRGTTRQPEEPGRQPPPRGGGSQKGRRQLGKGVSVRICVSITHENRQLVKAYARKHDVSESVALNRLLDLAARASLLLEPGQE